MAVNWSGDRGPMVSNLISSFVGVVLSFMLYLPLWDCCNRLMKP